ncbi:MAG TPA: translation initiation factor IF-2 [Candidatus Paceibacterota bacterium]|nr:translation initiation factor IF-2 [Candidatus Paceibacterota bacterium]
MAKHLKANNAITASGMKPRPPVVVIMGHVDHGKTTLLDHIRKANVAAREAGGITQAVGAYEIIHNTRKITFIDTPGHEAFSKMRSRGAEVADLAVLVVAADEGVKPQTKEAIDILLAAKTPFIAAINKIDRTGGNIDKAKNDLATAGVFLEGYGGQVSFHGISAKTGEGVNELLDLIILAADLEGLTFDPAAPASGYILESSHDSRRGGEASVIVKNGTLRRGANIYTKTASGKVKILENFLGKTVNELEPSAPALIMGFEGLPQVGEEFSTEPIVRAEAKKSAAKPVLKKSDRVLHLILKASDAGSLEALSAVLKAVDRGDKELRVLEESVGDVTDGDLNNAIAMNSHIIGFKVKVQKGARNLAEAHGVKIVTSEIIYDLVKAVEEFFKTVGQPPAMGELEVLAVFNQKKMSEQLVGGRVTLGNFRTKASFEIVHAGQTTVAGHGKVLGLREKKNEINSADLGHEIGVLLNSSVAMQVGDKLIIRK